MSSRLEKDWVVVTSHQTADGSRCVDIFSRPDGTFGFEEFRRDPEDMGAWTPVSYFSGRRYPTEARALEAAVQSIPWAMAALDSQIDRRRSARTGTPMDSPPSACPCTHSGQMGPCRPCRLTRGRLALTLPGVGRRRPTCRHLLRSRASSTESSGPRRFRPAVAHRHLGGKPCSPQR